jgi:hypothetical protein
MRITKWHKCTWKKLTGLDMREPLSHSIGQDKRYGSLEEDNWPKLSERRGTKCDLKGQCHEIFYLRFFSSNNFSWPQ